MLFCRKWQKGWCEINHRRTRKISICLALVVCLISTSLPCESVSAASVADIVGQINLESYTNYLRDDLYTHDGDERCFGPQHDLAQQRIQELFEGFGLESNLPEWAGGWTHVNPTGEGQAAMWQTFRPGRPNLTAVEIDILTISPGQGTDVLTVEIAKDGDVLASAECSIEDGFDGLMRFEFPEAVPLVPEQIYELKVRDTGKTRFGWKYGSNTYERGSRYVFAEERPGSDWFFQTYSNVEPAGAKYNGGTGEPNDPYQIATAEDLMLLGESPDDYDKHFILTADIDLDPNLSGRKVFDKAVIAPDANDATDWFDGTPFTGVFDGNTHIIWHLTMRGQGYLGLFGQLGRWDAPACEVRNLGLLDVNMTGSGDYVGGLVGYNYHGGSVTGCFSIASVSGKDRVGALVGSNYSGNITNCFSTGEVSGEFSIGGLLGSNDYGSLTQCYNAGSVNGWACVGGLVGYESSGSIATSYSTGSVRGTGDYVGGLVGYNGASTGTSYSTGSVSTAGDYVGGLVGYSFGNIAASYSSGSVSGNSDVGGLLGYNQADLTDSYSTGVVDGNHAVGGLIGENYSSNVTAVFWDIQTSGQALSAGGTGKTTAEMQTASTFLDAGWDFAGETDNGTEDIWWILEGKDYPRLWWESEEPEEN